MEDNYWSMGVPGPCGPCSEIYYDRGPEYGQEGGPVADEDRYLEVWNLVFMQFERGEGAGQGGLPDPRRAAGKNIDTGMGLERMAAILQGVDNIYEIDTLWPVLDRAAELTGAEYGGEHDADVALRVIADHMRTAVMLVADGVLPSQRGPRLRAAPDPAAQHLQPAAAGGRQRGGGADGRYLHELVEVALRRDGPTCTPSCAPNSPRILGVIDAEEEAFLSTLRTGSAIFDAAVEETRRRGSTPRCPGTRPSSCTTPTASRST